MTPPEPAHGISHQVYLVLCALFVTALLVANVAGGKLFVIGPLTLGALTLPGRMLPTGILTFPVTFVLTDLINEFYGKKGAVFVTWLGLAMSVLTYGVLFWAMQLPASPQSPISDAMFHQVFAASNRLIGASLCAYVIGQFLDIRIFQIFRMLTGERYLWFRATGSTVLSQLMDSIVVTFLSFGALLHFHDTWVLALNSYVIKFIVAVALTPALYVGRGIIARFLQPPAPIPVLSREPVLQPPLMEEAPI